MHLTDKFEQNFGSGKKFWKSGLNEKYIYKKNKNSLDRFVFDQNDNFIQNLGLGSIFEKPGKLEA